MKFIGIPMGISIGEFSTRLKAKGFKATIGDFVEDGTMFFSGNFFGSKSLLIVSYNERCSNSVYCVMVSKSSIDYETICSERSAIISSIELKYIQSKEPIGDGIDYRIYSSKSDNESDYYGLIHVGDISVSHGFNEPYTFNLIYSDRNGLIQKIITDNEDI